MPSMFPSLATPGEDPNRRIDYWKPGDPTPRVVIAGFAMILVAAVLMIYSGIGMFLLDWNREPINAQEAERMAFVQRNVRILAGLNIIFAIVLILLAPKVRDGYRNKRRLALWIACLAIFFMLAGWVLGFSGMGQSLIALLLAIAFLLVYRPAADPFFDAGHRLDPEPQHSQYS